MDRSSGPGPRGPLFLQQAAVSPRPQHYIGFGRCPAPMQNQSYGNWVMYHPRNVQQPGNLTLYVDTRNMGHVADASGSVTPRNFCITNLYIAFHNNSAVMNLAQALNESADYGEKPSFYRVFVNGQRMTALDMKNQLSEPEVGSTEFAMFSLKVTVKGEIKPSTRLFNITITKNCVAGSAACAAIPDPAEAFTSAQGHVVYSFWSVGQPLTINGVWIRDHAWCPVQTAINVEALPASLATPPPPSPPTRSPPPSRTSSPARRSPPPLMAQEASRPQYYVSFGNCPTTMQNQSFGNWVAYRSRSDQRPGNLTLRVDTRNMLAVADAAGNVVPRNFTITNLYVAYYNNTAVQEANRALGQSDSYIELSSYYRVFVNGVKVGTVKDMRNQLSGPRNASATFARFSLKATVGGRVFPSTKEFRISITKNCDKNCDNIPDPAVAFVHPTNDHVIYSFWSVKQQLSVNGRAARDHAWCPVQSAINIP